MIDTQSSTGVDVALPESRPSTPTPSTDLPMDIEPEESTADRASLETITSLQSCQRSYSLPPRYFDEYQPPMWHRSDAVPYIINRHFGIAWAIPYDSRVRLSLNHVGGNMRSDEKIKALCEFNTKFHEDINRCVLVLDFDPWTRGQLLYDFSNPYENGLDPMSFDNAWDTEQEYTRTTWNVTRENPRCEVLLESEYVTRSFWLQP
jgi:hypothetical protein